MLPVNRDDESVTRRRPGELVAMTGIAALTVACAMTLLGEALLGGFGQPGPQTAPPRSTRAPITMVAYLGMSNGGQIMRGLDRKISGQTLAITDSAWCNNGSCEPAERIDNGFWPGNLVYPGDRNPPAINGGAGTGVFWADSIPAGPTEWGWYTGNDTYWQYFDSMNIRFPASDVWVFMTAIWAATDSVPTDSIKTIADGVIDSLEARGFTPDRIHLNVIHKYESPNVCVPVGHVGGLLNDSLKAYLLRERNLKEAPTLDTLFDADRIDTCHMDSLTANAYADVMYTYFYGN